jgi:hypothetical protein
VNCKLFQVLLDDHVDGQLDRQTEADMLAHANTCAGCAALRASELGFRRSLQALPVPAPEPGFAERVFAAARVTCSRTRPPVSGRDERARAWLAAGGALAASLAIAVAVSVTREPAAVPRNTNEAALPIAHVQPAATAGVQPVRLVFRSATALHDVTIEIDLPEGVELEGFPGQRRLTWHSDLSAGSNLLELPVRLTGRGGVLIATLNHGTERRRFEVQLVSGPRPGVSSAIPSSEPGRRGNRPSTFA